MEVDAGPANNERPQGTKAQGQQVRQHPFVAQTSAVLDQSRTSPSGRRYRAVLDRSCAPRSGGTQGSGRKNSASSGRTKEWVTRKEKEIRDGALLTGCPPPAVSFTGGLRTPARQRRARCKLSDGAGIRNPSHVQTHAPHKIRLYARFTGLPPGVRVGSRQADQRRCARPCCNGHWTTSKAPGRGTRASGAS